MFKSRLGALFFVGTTMLGAATLVGDEEDGGALRQATDDLHQQREAMADEIAYFGLSKQETAEDVDVGFADEEELVDDAAGFDPTPESDMTDSEMPDEGQVVIVDRESGFIPE